MSTGGDVTVPLGCAGSVPVTGDFDGDGASDCGCYTPATGSWEIALSSGGLRTEPLGAAGAIPIVGDFDGDGMADVGGFSPGDPGDARRAGCDVRVVAVPAEHGRFPHGEPWRCGGDTDRRHSPLAHGARRGIMIKPDMRRGSVRAIGDAIYLLALALWVGGGALYTFVLTPAIFASYPRNTAGEIVGTMMPHYFLFQLAATGVAALVLVALWRGWPGRRRVLCLALLIGALGAQSYVQWRLYPQILQVKARVASFEAAPDAPERRRFRTLHGVSMLVNLLVLADGALLLALSRRPADR